MRFWVQSYVHANDHERDGAPLVAFSMEEAEEIAKEQKKTHERVMILDDHDDLGGQQVLKIL